MKHIIYALIDPNTDQIRYIGKTSNLSRRLITHHSPSSIKTNTHKNNWLRSLISNGQKAKCMIIQTYNTKEELIWAEKIWIANYRILNCNLVNATNGGEGGKTSSRSGSNNPMFGRRHSKETKNKMRTAAYKRDLTISPEKQKVMQAAIKRWNKGNKNE